MTLSNETISVLSILINGAKVNNEILLPNI